MKGLEMINVKCKFILCMCVSLSLFISRLVLLDMINIVSLESHDSRIYTTEMVIGR